VPETPTPGRTFSPVNPASYNKVGAAGQELGGAVGGLGDLATRIKGVYDDAAITKISSTAQIGVQESIKKMTTAIDPETGQPIPENNDPTTYAKRWQDMKASLQDQATNDPMGKSLSPMSRMRLKMALGHVFALGDSDVRDATRQKMLEVAGAVNDQALEGVLNSGRPDAERTALSMADKEVATGMKTPEWGAQQHIDIPRRIDQNAVMHLMTTPVEMGGGPFVAQDKLQEQDGNGKFTNFTRLLPEQRQELIRQTSYDGRILRDQTANKYGTMIANKEPIDPVELKNDLAYRTITPALYRSLSKPPRPEGDTAEGFASVMSKIAGLDLGEKSSDPDSFYSTQYDIGRAINNFTGVNRTQAEKFLNAKLDPAGPMNTEAVKAVMDANNQMFSKGGYGQYEVTHQPTKDELAANPDAKPTTSFVPNIQLAARQKQAQVATKVMAYVLSHPGSENNPDELMKVYAAAAKSARGTAGVGLFQPPRLVPSGPAASDGGQQDGR
jgi:hypothetical protein